MSEPDEIESATICTEAEHGNVIDVRLSAEAALRRAERVSQARREMFLSSSCGLCGRQTIERVFQSVGPIEHGFTITRALLEGLPDRMRQAQDNFAQTGGLHAAALFATDGQMIVLREDIGRHNAVDKVIGHQALIGRYPINPGKRHGAGAVLLVSGRAGFEIVQKAAVAGIGFIASVGAPSSLAAQTAATLGITLVGFLRPGRMNIYHDTERARLIL